MDIAQIKKLIQLVNDNNVGELKVEEGDLKISIKHRDFIKQTVVSGASVAAPVAQLQSLPAPSNEVKEDKTTAESSSAIAIKAPMIGTFYRSSSPDKPAFVKVGDVIQKGDVLCIIEAMKLFNEIQSEVSGKIVKVNADNAQPVEYDQVLFLVEPN